MPALGLKLRLNRISARILQVITTGLVMWQKMNLTPWSGSSRLIDASGNANNATAFTGRGLSFDGVNDVVTVGNTGNTVRSVVFLAYPDTTTQSFMQLTASGGVDIGITSGTLSGAGWTSPTYYVNGVASTTVAATTWQQIAVTSATAITASDVRLGLDNTTYYSGDLCNVKFFSVQLSAAQIAELYANPELAFPTGTTAADLVDWWPLAEGASAGIALDGATVKNNGTISGPADVLNLPNPCPQWAFEGNSWPMGFDNSNDYIECGTALGSLNITGNKLTIYQKFINNNTGSDLIVLKGSSGLATGYATSIFNERFYFGIYGGVTPTGDLITNVGTAPDFTILDVVCTYDGANKKIYINNVLSATAACTGNINSHNVALRLSNASSAFGGIIFEAGVWNKDLSAAQIESIYNGADFTTIESANLKGAWKNTGNQNSDWLDLSGNANNGTVNGSPGRVFLPEGTATGKDLVGINLGHPNLGAMYGLERGYLRVADANSLDLTNSLSIETWVKPEVMPVASQWIVSKDNATLRSFGFQYLGTSTSNGGKIGFYFFSSSTFKDSISSSTIPLNTWSHICATYDGASVKFYINGILNRTVTQTGTIDVTTVDLLIGTLGRITDPGDYFQGYIDDVRIYNVALTAAQIANNYTAGKGAHQY